MESSQRSWRHMASLGSKELMLKNKCSKEKSALKKKKKESLF